jgi:4-diphosphocytidyl-2-C-methyl-D-erythritol kinase
VRAAELLMQEFGIDGLDIHLDKLIPIGAGLGGGSSDAAAILKGAMKLYDLRIDNNNILKLAAHLGSDVPFFLNGKTAHVSGRGEIIQPIKIKLKYYVLLVISSFKISTAEAYKRHNIHLTKNEYDYKFNSSILSGLNVSSFKNIFYNDFEKSVFRDYSELADIKNLLYVRGAKFASLSGSGSTVFGLFLTQKEVQQAYLNLSEKYICIIANPVY